MRNLVVVLVIIGLVAGGFACQGGPTVPEWILVGVPAPLTGAYAGFGKGGRWGIEAAIADINALGGVMVGEYGTKIKMKAIVLDTESSDTKAGTIAESLILEDEVNFLAYGDQPPPMNAPIAAKAELHKIPYVCTTGPAEPWIGMRSAAGNWSYTWACGLFSIGEYKPEAGYTIADTWLALLDEVGSQTNKVAGVFACDDSDGAAWHAAFPGILESKGYTVVAKAAADSLLPVETSDFSALIDKWVDADVEVIWGNAIAPFVGTLLKQAYENPGFHPKLISIGRAPLFYEDVSSWVGDAPLGVLVEIWWDPAWGGGSTGFGTTTPASLAERYLDDTGAEAVNRNIGAGYSVIQVLVDAIQRAGTLDPAEVNAALAATDLMTIRHRVKFDENQFNRGPLVYGQWQKVEGKWVCPIVLSKHDFIPTTGTVLFPIP